MVGELRALAGGRRRCRVIAVLSIKDIPPSTSSGNGRLGPTVRRVTNGYGRYVAFQMAKVAVVMQIRIYAWGVSSKAKEAERELDRSVTPTCEVCHPPQGAGILSGSEAFHRCSRRQAHNGDR